MGTVTAAAATFNRYLGMALLAFALVANLSGVDIPLVVAIASLGVLNYGIPTIGVVTTAKSIGALSCRFGWP